LAVGETVTATEGADATRVDAITGAASIFVGVSSALAGRTGEFCARATIVEAVTEEMGAGRDAARIILSANTSSLPGSVPGDVTTLDGGLTAGIVVMATCAAKQPGMTAHAIDCTTDGTTSGATDAITALEGGTVLAAGSIGNTADIDGPGATYVALVGLAATTAMRT